MNKKKRRGKTLRTREEILASLIGVATALIAFYIAAPDLFMAISNLWDEGYIICMTPYFIGVIFGGMFAGWLGAVIAAMMIPRFRELEVPKWLVIVLGSALGGISVGLVVPLVITFILMFFFM